MGVRGGVPAQPQIAPVNRGAVAVIVIGIIDAILRMQDRHAAGGLRQPGRSGIACEDRDGKQERDEQDEERQHKTPPVIGR